jgi:hypothetical protein
MNRLQRHQLELLRQFQHKDMSILSLLWFNRRIYLILVAIAVASVVAMNFLVGSYAAGLVAVAYATMLLRDLGHFRRSAVIWPLTRELVDWSKVSEQADKSAAGV